MKKLNKKGFTIVEMAIVVVIVGFAVGIGLFAKNRVQNNANAGSMTVVTSYQGALVRACRARSNVPKKLKILGSSYGVRGSVSVRANFMGATTTFTPNVGGVSRDLTAHYNSSSPSFGAYIYINGVRKASSTTSSFNSLPTC